MKLAANDVQSLLIPGTGHWVAETAPDQMLAPLPSFVARAATEGESAERRAP
jgi:hypothetical protein